MLKLIIIISAELSSFLQACFEVYTVLNVGKSQKSINARNWMQVAIVAGCNATATSYHQLLRGIHATTQAMKGLIYAYIFAIGLAAKLLHLYII